MEVTVLVDMVRNTPDRRYPRGAPRLALLASLAALTLLFAACAEMPTSALACANGQNKCTPPTRAKVVVQDDNWQDANNPRRMLARIQSNLDRVSAGQPTWPEPSGEASDPLLKIIDAYADFLRGDIKGMDAQLVVVENSVKMVRTGYGYGHPAPYAQQNRIAVDKRYLAATHDSSPLVRLYAGVRAVEGALLDVPLEEAPEYISIHTSTVSPLYGASLRLPCRTVIARVQQFVAASTTLQSLGGPVLDCPVDGTVDYVKDELLALHPESFSPHVRPPNPAPQPAAIANVAKAAPGSRAAAIEDMAADPQQSAPILERYSKMDAQGELDYLLFLHAFEPKTPARDTTIRSLQADLQKKAMTSRGAVHDFPPTPYDGTDASLLNVIRLTSETGIVGTGYAIPCPILVARPALVAATDPYYFSNRDNFMPSSGCTGGEIPGFPTKAVAAFEAASTEADGNFIATFQGSMVYGFEAAQNAANQKMRLDPYYFLIPHPNIFGYPGWNLDYPYQVWGYTSLNNYVVSLRLRKLYFSALDQLTAYYEKPMGLDRQSSREAARVALFLATFGGNCGDDVPTVSLRRMLLEHAPLNTIKKQLKGSYADAPEIEACAEYAGVDPLLLVAVGDPVAFPLFLTRARDVNIRNPIGKTPLMEAAQFNELKIVHLLLAHHARVNFTTWGDSDPLHGLNSQLGDDARTALMYAAANGSLKLIKTLLDAGADPFQADTKGYRAIDYLLGYGPTPPNPHLSKRERGRAARWLF